MQIAVLVLPTFWELIQGRFVESPHFSPVWRDRLGELFSRHQVAIFPRPADSLWSLNEMLLSPTFYSEVCQPRITSAPESRGGKEGWILAGIQCEGAAELVQTIRDRLSGPPPDPKFSTGLLDSYVAWKRLEEILARAFPDASSLLPNGCDSSFGIPIDNLARHADQTWELLNYYHPPGILNQIAEFEPRVIFIVGEFPQRLPLAAAYAIQLRRTLPDTTMILCQTESDIYSSMAQTMPALTRARSLFDYFDAATVHADIQDLTVCHVIERLATGKDTLSGIENLVCKSNGQIEYREPESRTISDYLQNTHLGSIFADLSGGEPLAKRGGEPLPKLFPTITAAKQTCYWDRCHFCPTSSQSWIKHDPFLDRRAAETASLLLDLRSAGAEMTFVGREVVPPTVLESMVAALRDRAEIPRWSFEGKFETLYTEPFIEDLALAGCRGVIFGLESPSDHLNQAMDKHRSGISVERIEKIISRMDAAGIAVHVNTIYNLPGTTKKDFEHHKEWLTQTFNRLRFFHFNTNALQILPGSRMSINPEDYGIQLDESSNTFPVSLRFRREDATGASPLRSDEIWQDAFGSHWYRGCPLELMHAIYHESTSCSFWDAAAGRNHFKTIQSQIQHYAHPDILHFQLADSVQIVESESDDQQRVWLVDVGGTAGWVRLPSLLWRIIEASVEQDMDLNGAATQVAPLLSYSEKAQLRKTVTRLLARGILTCTRGAAVSDPGGERSGICDA